MVPTYEGKGDIQDCKNYRGIRLISLYKNLGKILNMRIRKDMSNLKKQFIR